MSMPIDPADPIVVEMTKEEAYKKFWKLVPWTFEKHRRKLRHHGYYDDLQQEGWIGVEYALRYWKPDGGAKLSSFVANNIHWAMMHALRDWKFGPKTSGVAAPFKILNFTDTQRFQEDSNSIGRDDMEPPAPPVLPHERRDARRMLKRLAPDATRRELLVIFLHYFRGQTLEVIASRLGVTRERVRQLIVSAFNGRSYRAVADQEEALGKVLRRHNELLDNGVTTEEIIGPSRRVARMKLLEKSRPKKAAKKKPSGEAEALATAWEELAAATP